MKRFDKNDFQKNINIKPQLISDLLNIVIFNISKCDVV